MNREAHSFLLKLILFVSPFALALVAEVAVFPIDAFAFRSWEALAVSTNQWTNQFFAGMPFYPSRKLEKQETGDLGHHTVYATAKHVAWETDAWGFRNGLNAGGKYDVVIVGDSFTAGSALSQDGMLSAQLEQSTDLRTYAYAPSTVKALLAERRFRTRPRPTVVFQFLERELLFRILWLKEVVPLEAADATDADEEAGTVERAWYSTLTALDRYCKGMMLLWARARLNDSVSGLVYEAIGREYVKQPAATIAEDGETLFLLGSEANLALPQNLIDRATARIVEFDRATRLSGYDFVVLATPNKENIYYDLLPDSRRPDFLDRVVTGARREGVDVVDLQPAFRSARKAGVQLYHQDDTHWTAEGAGIAARALGERLLQKRLNVSQVASQH